MFPGEDVWELAACVTLGRSERCTNLFIVFTDDPPFPVLRMSGKLLVRAMFSIAVRLHVGYRTERGTRNIWLKIREGSGFIFCEP